MATKLTNDQIELAVKEAFYSAYQATKEYQEKNPNWYPCGFSWVEIKPARGAVVKYLKDNGRGSAGYNGGWTIWNPSNVSTQQMDALFAGSEAFVNVMKEKLGMVKIEAYSRMD